MKKLLFIICLISTTISFAKKWDAVYINKLITNGDIDKVIQHYQDAYYGDDRNPQDAFKIAELYVKKKDYASAMQWYDKEKQLINTSKVNLFNYANTNRLMGEYQKALDGYLMYAANTGDVNKVMDLANQCERILKLSAQSSNYKLDNYTYNTADDETNIAFLRTNAIYNTLKNATDKEEKQTCNINQVVRTYENFGEPVKAYNNNIPKLIITSLSYTKDGNTVVFSAKEEKAVNKKNIKNNEKIYIADNLGGDFLNAKPISFNTEGYSLKNPSFNDDGTSMYFSSNLPGGAGGFDIWKSDVVKGKWSVPVNLGNLVNSKADEINPFIVQDGNQNTLYFSTNRDGGFGGFDIFSAKKSSNIWQDAEMQPAPINSAGDDISIVYDNEVKTGYFSSNRIDGKGGFDLYRFTPFKLNIIVNVVDSITNKPVDYAFIQLSENGIKEYEGVTNENGKAVFQVGKNKSFRIAVSKDNYRPVVTDANTTGMSNGDSVEINIAVKEDAQFSIKKGATNNLSMSNYIIFTGHVTDAATNKPAVNAKMRMVNYATQKVRELDLDKDGKFEIKLLQNNNYKVIFENQSAKITDELTSYGLEKNDVKVRDYQLSSSKFKLTENKVYKNGNLPPNIKVENPVTGKINITIPTITNEPITKTKIDSLMKVITVNNPQQQINKVTTAPVINTSTVMKEENVKDLAEPLKEKEKQTIVVGPEDKQETAITKVAPEKIQKENTQLAADIITKNNRKKVKIIETDVPAEITEIPKEETVVKELPKEVAAENAVQPAPAIKAERTAETTTELSKEKPETIVTEIPVKIEEKKSVEIPIKAIAITEKSTTTENFSKPIATETKVINTEELPDIYFKIQLASYEVNNLQFPEFDNYGKVEMVKAYDRYIYRLGNFADLDRAKQILEQVRSQGYFVAFILQYNKDKVSGIIK